jgi:hypothetical protein
LPAQVGRIEQQLALDDAELLQERRDVPSGTIRPCSRSHFAIDRILPAKRPVPAGGRLGHRRQQARRLRRLPGRQPARRPGAEQQQCAAGFGSFRSDRGMPHRAAERTFGSALASGIGGGLNLPKFECFHRALDQRIAAPIVRLRAAEPGSWSVRSCRSPSGHHAALDEFDGQQQDEHPAQRRRRGVEQAHPLALQGVRALR